MMQQNSLKKFTNFGISPRLFIIETLGYPQNIHIGRWKIDDEDENKLIVNIHKRINDESKASPMIAQETISLPAFEQWVTDGGLEAALEQEKERFIRGEEEKRLKEIMTPRPTRKKPSRKLQKRAGEVK